MSKKRFQNEISIKNVQSDMKIKYNCWLMRQFNKYWLILLIVFVLLLPIMTNLIIGSKCPFELDVVGTGEDWIGFYGNYFGSLITGFISFFILYKTINSNKKDADINRKKQDIENLALHLSKTSAILNFERIGFNDLYVFNDELCNIEIDNLKKIKDEISRKNVEIHLLYNNARSEYIKMYFEIFDKCIDSINEKISIMISAYQGIIGKDLKSERDKNVELIKKTRYQLINLNKSLGKELFEKASNWITIEKDEYNRLIGS